MTDRELQKRFRAAPIKAVMVIEAAKAEGQSIPEMVTRLERMNCKARVGIRRVFKRLDIENIDEAAVKKYLKKYGKAREDEKPREGCVDDFCKTGGGRGTCRYLDTAYGCLSCTYYTTMGIGHRRGCPAGKGCRRYEPRRGKAGNDTELMRK